MTRLTWDQVADRRYETGIDRGVLFSAGRPAVAWNGLTSVTDTGARETKEYYYEGVKILERIIPGAFSGKIEAITYPDVLDELTGIRVRSAGVRVHDCRSEPFHLTYRTRIGNVEDGVDYGYKLHLIYNVLANPDDVVSKTIGSSVEPTPFSWSLSGMQKFVLDGQPLDHISIDSSLVDPTWLQNLENLLYGTDSTSASMPSASVVAS